MDDTHPTSGAGAPYVFGVAGTREVVANSLSPRMMRAAFEHLELDAYYVPLALRERSARKALRGIVRLGFAGCNVTMPFKGLAAQVADSRSEAVERSGVANTLVVRPDGTLHAEATDGAAVVAAIADRGVTLTGAHVVVLGAGGSATDAAVACVGAGAARIDVWNRTRSRAELLVERLHEIAPDRALQVLDRMPIREPAHVLLGCVPADSLDPRSLTGLHPGTLVVDLAYRRDGRPTALQAASSTVSGECVGGRELLVRQGAGSLEAWLGVEAPIEVMTRAVR